jgi:hypothetical protein
MMLSAIGNLNTQIRKQIGADRYKPGGEGKMTITLSLCDKMLEAYSDKAPNSLGNLGIWI